MATNKNETKEVKNVEEATVTVVEVNTDAAQAAQEIPFVVTDGTTKETAKMKKEKFGWFKKHPKITMALIATVAAGAGIGAGIALERSHEDQNTIETVGYDDEDDDIDDDDVEV